MTTVSGLESVVDSISSAATDTYTPGFGNSTSIGNVGGASDCRIVVVNGDAAVGPGTGYGVLLVRGVLTVSGNLTWNGLVLVIGQGEIHWNSAVWRSDTEVHTLLPSASNRSMAFVSRERASLPSPLISDAIASNRNDFPTS